MNRQASGLQEEHGKFEQILDEYIQELDERKEKNKQDKNILVLREKKLQKEAENIHVTTIDAHRSRELSRDNASALDASTSDSTTLKRKKRAQKEIMDLLDGKN